MRGRVSDSESSKHKDELGETWREEEKAFRVRLKNRQRQNHEFSGILELESLNLIQIEKSWGFKIGI